MDAYWIPNSDQILMLYEESRSKMLLKEQDPMAVKNKVNTKPINYAILNNDYNKRFVRTICIIEWTCHRKALKHSVPSLTILLFHNQQSVKVPKEFPNVINGNTSLKSLNAIIAGSDQVSKSVLCIMDSGCSTAHDLKNALPSSPISSEILGTVKFRK
ncbi:hypothetical protein Tco_0085303 [Tanacetum coccineum]